MTDLTPLDLDEPRCADCPIRGACNLNCPAHTVDPDALHVHLWEVRSWHSDFPERHGGTSTLACAACSASVEVTPWATSHLDLNEARSALCDAADEVERLRAAVVERDTRLAETIRYHDARVNRADEATDASRTAHAALVADLRALPVTTVAGVTVIHGDVLAILDRHAPDEGR